MRLDRTSLAVLVQHPLAKQTKLAVLVNHPLPQSTKLAVRVQARLERTTLRQVAKSIELQVSSEEPCVLITLDTETLSKLQLPVDAWSVRCAPWPQYSLYRDFLFRMCCIGNTLDCVCGTSCSCLSTPGLSGAPLGHNTAFVRLRENVVDRDSVCYNRDEASRPTGQLGEFEQDSNTDSEQESTTDSHGDSVCRLALACTSCRVWRRPALAPEL